MRAARATLTAGLLLAFVTGVVSGRTVLFGPQAGRNADHAIVLAGGCFWGVEAVFEHVRGVQSATSGFARYADPASPAPIEAVRIIYNSSIVTHRQLLEVFFLIAHDPTTRDRQGPDRGPEYRAVVFFQNQPERAAAETYVAELARAQRFPRPIVTEVRALSGFTVAGAAHQNYGARHPTDPYVVQNDAPKLAALEQQFPRLYQQQRAPLNQMDEQLLTDQVSYYRARAGEYDQWFLRQGRYDRGPEHRAAWFGEIAIVETALNETVHDCEVLELACGTGLWTRRLAAHNRRVVAVDASPEVIAINRGRVCATNVDYVTADLFSWTPAQAFDAIFFSFWLSHVPPARFDPFWTMVRAALRPGGRAFFIDSLQEQSSTAVDHDPLDGSGIVRRKLNDGREFSIVKVFHDPAALERRLLDGGWDGWVRPTGRFFLYGSMTPVG